MPNPHRFLANLEFQSGTLVLDRWTAAQIQHYFPEGFWKWDDRTDSWRTQASYYSRISEVLQSHSVGTVDLVPQWQTVNWPSVSLHAMRDEQNAAVEKWFEKKEGILVMPTGTGKTEVALHILEKLRCSALIVSPIRDLMYQWQQRIHRGLGYDAGVIGDSILNRKPVSVTTYESASIHMPRLGNYFQCIVFDECHHLRGSFREDASRMCAAPYRLGLTATLDGTLSIRGSLTELIGPVVYELKLDDVRGGSLADYDVYRIAVELNVQERARYQELGKMIQEYVFRRGQTEEGFTWQKLCSESRTDGEAHAVLLGHRERQAIEDKAAAKFRVIEDLLHLHQGTPMVIFAGSNAMAREVSTRLLIPCLLSHCGKKERRNYLDGLRDGTYNAIVANQILDEGVDIPSVKVAVVIGGMASTRQATQRLGRVLRKQGNERAILYEVVCQETQEVDRSRKRRRSDAYKGTRHLKH